MRKRPYRVSLNNPWHQYLIAVIFNLFFLAVLWNSPVAYRNIQIPEGEYSDNCMAGTDVTTYVSPARHFLEHGGFLIREAEELVPDYHRTVGYPLIISGFIELFGEQRYLLPLYIFHCLFFALAYPSITVISRTLFPGRDRMPAILFILTLITGAYWSMIPYVLSDLFFAVMLLSGFAAGVRGIVRRSWWLIAGHIILIGFAAQIRPALLLYIPVEIFLFYYLWKKQGVRPHGRDRSLFALSVVMISFFVMLPSLRNYANYGFFGPSDIIYKNFSDFLCRDVLDNNQQYREFKENSREYSLPGELSEWIDLQKDFSAEVIMENPVRTAGYLFRMSARNLTAPHWHYVFKPFWITHIKSKVSHSGRAYRRTAPAVIVFNSGRVFYVLIYMIIAAGMAVRLKEGVFLDETLLILLTAALLAPTIIAGGGSRMRVPVEGFLLMYSLNYLYMFRQRYFTEKGAV